MEHIKLFKCLYMYEVTIFISELRCHGNHLTSSKAVPLCLKQILVVTTSIIQISDKCTSFFNYIEVFMHHFLHNSPHTQRMTNFVTIFRWRFTAPVWHSLTRKRLCNTGPICKANSPHLRKILSRDGLFSEIIIARHSQLNRHSL